MDLKSEIISVLSPIFGESVRNMIEDNYDSKNPSELIEMAHHMITGYMGEENANRLLDKIIKKYPKLEIKVH
ncbi:MAG: hypothetical protein NDI94_01400 [Candidatus Woesearchaeota archaeon]|nr:hypothetical protein [Candidatus Woesearchaeota archaeon]